MPLRKSWTICDDLLLLLEFDCNCWRQMLQCNEEVGVIMVLLLVVPPPRLSGRAASEADLFAIVNV